MQPPLEMSAFDVVMLALPLR